MPLNRRGRNETKPPINVGDRVNVANNGIFFGAFVPGEVVGIEGPKYTIKLDNGPTITRKREKLYTAEEMKSRHGAYIQGKDVV